MVATDVASRGIGMIKLLPPPLPPPPDPFLEGALENTHPC
jgi:hypothetical protein